MINGSMRLTVFVATGLLLVVSLSRPTTGQTQGDTPPADPVARLSGQIEKGEAALEYQANGRGYLPGLLAALGVSLESQMLDIYFNDNVFVRFRQDGTLQLATADPERGIVFYDLQNSAASKPRIERRDTECAGCHGSGSSAAVLASAGVPPVTPPNDLVALMTFEHQVGMTNLIGAVGRQARAARGAGGPNSATSAGLDAAIEPLITHMLFADEAPLREPLKGVSTFAETFQIGGPRDGEGRSLRDFDLQTRLFRYPLSYMVYSETFDALPSVALDRIYKRLFEVLSGQDDSPPFARLSADDRRAALEILVDTKRSLPGYFR